MATVVKRDGSREPVRFDRILERIEALCEGLRAVDPVHVAQRVVQGVRDGISTHELDELTAAIREGVSKGTGFKPSDVQIKQQVSRPDPRLATKFGVGKAGESVAYAKKTAAAASGRLI